MTIDLPCGPGSHEVGWMYPRIGTCGDPMDTLRISLCRVRAISDLIIGFDGERSGWVICGSFYTQARDDFELREVAFIPEDDLDDDRFSAKEGEHQADD